MSFGEEEETEWKNCERIGASIFVTGIALFSWFTNS